MAGRVLFDGRPRISYGQIYNALQHCMLTDSLEAVLLRMMSATMAYGGDRYEELLSELRQTFPELTRPA